MKFRIIFSILVVAVLAALVYLQGSSNTTSATPMAPSSDDAAMKNFKIE